MRAALLLFALGLGVLQIPEPPEFPAGHVCVRADRVRSEKDHACACRDDDDCSKPETGQGSGPSENSKCLQYCHKEHCSCKTPCE